MLAGVATMVHLFVMRASFSGAAFCQASLVETQQAFLELHAQAFEWFGGVFPKIKFDNLKSAVKKVLKGRRRVESDRFVALRSHYLFASQFTTPGLEGAHEKGGVEGEVGRCRRNHLVPVLHVADLAELNALLLAGCEADLDRRIDGRPVTVRDAWATERPLLLALPVEPFDACETAAPRVDAKSLVTIRQNRYSVPVALAGLKVSARVGAREITINHGGREVARHERIHGKFGTSAQLDHYLELLARKPGGLEHSLALSQERDRGSWPGCFDQLWAALTERYGRSDAARQMVDVVLLCREHGPERVALAVRGALTVGAIDGRAVAVLARRAESAPVVAVPLSGLEPRLAAHERPAPGGPRRLRPAAQPGGGTMIGPEPYCALEAFIETDQLDWTGDRAPRQLVTVIMTDGTIGLAPAVCALTTNATRDLAFELLVIAEHAEQLTGHREEQR